VFGRISSGQLARKLMELQKLSMWVSGVRVCWAASWQVMVGRCTRGYTCLVSVAVLVIKAGCEGFRCSNGVVFPLELGVLTTTLLLLLDF
jgi:hypothetical protein